MKQSLRQSIRILRGSVTENGVLWTVCFCLQRLLSHLAECVNGYMRKRELRYRLPGDNTVQRNLQGWQSWNWQSRGEEWTVSEEWKQSLVNEVLLRYIAPNKVVLEIGPGGGRWSEILQKNSRQLILVDLTPKCIEICKERFSHCTNVEYYLNNGRSLEFLRDSAVDFVWSFDAFVHISAIETEDYIKELSRVLTSGGRGVIHHPGAGGSLNGGWRSNTTKEMFAEMLRRHNLRLVTQFDSWGPEGRFDVRRYNDQISVFEK